MTKDYTWEEIENFLKSQLNKTKHILTFGTLGSHNIEHDIDIMITKKSTSPSSSFYREVHNIYDALNNFLNKNCNGKLLSLPSMVLQSIAAYLGIVKKNDLKIHVMIYFSYPQLEKDWAWSISKREKVEKILLSDYSIMYGKISDIFSKDFKKEGNFDNLFIYLYTRDLIYSNLPKSLKLDIMNVIFDFILRKRLKQETLIAKNDEDLKNIFYSVCDKIDEADKDK